MIDEIKMPAIVVAKPGEFIILEGKGQKFIDGSERILPINEMGEIIERLDYHLGDCSSSDSYAIVTAKGLAFKTRKILVAPNTKGVHWYLIRFDRKISDVNVISGTYSSVFSTKFYFCKAECIDDFVDNSDVCEGDSVFLYVNQSTMNKLISEGKINKFYIMDGNCINLSSPYYRYRDIKSYIDNELVDGQVKFERYRYKDGQENA